MWGEAGKDTDKDSKGQREDSGGRLIPAVEGHSFNNNNNNNNNDNDDDDNDDNDDDDDGDCDVVCIANHSRSISITEYSLCTPKVIIVQKSYSFQHNRSACRTAAHDMLRAQLETCNYHLNPGLSIQSLS